VRRAAAVFAVMLWPALATAAALTLDERGRQEAVRVGEKSITDDAFDAEWRVTNDRGDMASVLTPFHRLVVASRHAAFGGKPLKPSEENKVLKETRDRLVLAVDLHGTREDFARYYAPRLLVGDREIKPAFVQNERTAKRQDDGRYVARCVYAFPSRDVDGRARAALIVADSDGRDVSRFTIDLGRMR
jgi:hypothetical protein